MGDTLGELMPWAKFIDKIEQQPQCQGALVYQLNLLHAAANKLGLYDAADYLAMRPKGSIPGPKAPGR